MAAKINKNRYRLITLLYVIFVCLSVLNIPYSLLDSNYYWIKTLEYQERERLLQVDFANKVIGSHAKELNRDSTLVYLSIQAELHKNYLWTDSLDKLIINGLAEKGTNIKEQFQDKRKIEEILLKDSLIYRFKERMFALNDFMKSQPYRIDSAVEELMPVKDKLFTLSQKEISWERYLFLHKPTAISYVQIKRIKLLLLENEYVYQIAALKTIDYLLAFYSRSENRVFLDRKDDQSIQLTRPPEIKVIKPVLPPGKQDTTGKQPVKEQQEKKAKDENELDRLSQEIFSSLHTENLYVGVANTLLKSMNTAIINDFSVTVEPTAELVRVESDYNIVFRKPGDYVLRFTDIRNNARKPLFEKRIRASLLPNPVVKLNIENTTKDVLSTKELLALNRLVTVIDIGSQTVQSRVNGFRFTRIAKSGEQKSVYNYSEVFRGPLQEMIAQLQKGDIVFFDNITILLPDGTTRTPSPILYKIID